MKSIPSEVLQLSLGYLDDLSLARACMINKDMNKRVCNNTFWINKIVNRFGLSINEINDYRGNNSYAAYYFDLADWVNVFGGSQLGTLLRKAAKNGRLDVVKVAFITEPEISNYYAKYAIHETQDYNVIRFLLENPNTIERVDLNIALEKAVKRGDYRSVEILLEHGANPRYDDDYLIGLSGQRKHRLPDYEKIYNLLMAKKSDFAAGLNYV